MEEICIKEEPLQPFIEILPIPRLEIRPTIKDEPESLSDNEFSGSESQLSTDAHLNIKKETVEQYDIFVKEDVEVLPFCFNGASSSSGSVIPNDLSKNPNIGTDKVKTKRTYKHKEKTLECSYCSKKFSWKRDLHRHTLSHTGEKPYECPGCSKRFSQNTHMLRHMVLHSGEKPHECDLCSKKFRHKGDLQRHILSHMGHKLYECPKCEKEFIRNVHLQRHMFTHTGEKPLDCPQCNRKFTRKERLVRHHLVTHMGEKPHECPHCDKKFSRTDRLLRHRLLTHKEEYS